MFRCSGYRWRYDWKGGYYVEPEAPNVRRRYNWKLVGWAVIVVAGFALFLLVVSGAWQSY